MLDLKLLMDENPDWRLPDEVSVLFVFFVASIFKNG
jgi:hypothetical protein